jgi:YHS domain-containing protein
MTEQRTIAPNEDPVCGMIVDLDDAREKGLTLTHAGREFGFCGKGCFLEFRDDPERFLDPAYEPTM